MYAFFFSPAGSFRETIIIVFTRVPAQTVGHSRFTRSTMIIILYCFFVFFFVFYIITHSTTTASGRHEHRENNRVPPKVQPNIITSSSSFFWIRVRKINFNRTAVCVYAPRGPRTSRKKKSRPVNFHTCVFFFIIPPFPHILYRKLKIAPARRPFTCRTRRARAWYSGGNKHYCIEFTKN